MLQVVKRNGKKVAFDENKISAAILKAMDSPSGVYIKNQPEHIAYIIKEKYEDESEISIYDIEEAVYYELIKNNNPATARAYESYKSIQAYKREQNTSDNDILGLLNQTNIDVMDENSNKNPLIASTQRDLIAGEVAKDIAKRIIVEEVVG